jgi:hypothetical protein
MKNLCKNKKIIKNSINNNNTTNLIMFWFRSCRVGDHAVEEQGYEEQGCNFLHICFILEKAKRNLNS